MKKNYFLKLAFLAFALITGSSVYSQSCNSTTLESGLYSPSQLITCDFNGDGYEDIVFLDSVNYNLWWKRNDADTKFDAAEPLVGGAEILFLEVGDLTNDGFDEIIFATATTVYYVQYLSATNIDFVTLLNAPTLSRVKALKVGDFNNDNFDGFVVGFNSSSGLSLRIDVITNVNGTLSNQTILSGLFGNISDLAVGDISNNGYMDIATTGYNNLWFSNNNLTFSADKTIRSAGGNSGRIMLMDMDNDNQLELINLNSSGTLQFYGIDPNGINLYSGVTIMSGLPSNPDIWQMAKENGNDVILTGSANELIGLENKNSSFVKNSYCSGISNLSGGTQLRKKDGTLQHLYASSSQKTIERIDVTTGIEEATEAAYGIFPNPTNGILNIEVSQSHSIKSIRMLNAQGQLVNPTVIGKNKYDIGSFPNGLYHLMIEDNAGNRTTRKVFKVK